jgi:hypothetical protein
MPNGGSAFWFGAGQVLAAACFTGAFTLALLSNFVQSSKFKVQRNEINAFEHAAKSYLEGSVPGGGPRRTLLKKTDPARILLLAGAVSLMFNLFQILRTGKRLPLYGVLESLTTICLVAAVCLCLRPFSPKTAEGTIGAGILALLAALALFFPLSLNPDFFMYASPWVQAFFFLRLLSGGIVLYAGIRFSASLAGRGRLSSGAPGLEVTYRFFLWASVLFLLSELSGSIWCLKGWGDSWRFSENFFQSTALFFLMMLNFHLPPFLAKHGRRKCLLGVVSCASILFFLIAP